MDIPYRKYEVGFQYAQGTRPFGAPRSVAGSRTRMTWAEGVVAQAQGMGEIVMPERPHERRPELLDRHAPANIDGGDDLTARQRALNRVRERRGSAAPARSVSGVGSNSDVANRRGKSSPTHLMRASPPGRGLGVLEASRLGAALSGASTSPGSNLQKVGINVCTEAGHQPGHAESTTAVSSSRATSEPDDHAGTVMAGLATSNTKGPTGLASRGIGVADAARLGQVLWSRPRETEGGSRIVGERAEDCKASPCGSVRQSASSSGTMRVVRIGEALYCGAADSRGRPQGTGTLLLPDGSAHRGCFESGRAHGLGEYAMPTGLALSGRWESNLRVGCFELVDSHGKLWTETYNTQGKKISRESRAGDGQPPATTCTRCKGLYHGAFNHAHACRRHRGNWVAGIDGSDDGGYWECCRARAHADRGCDVGPHVVASLDKGVGNVA